jgi:hypothetical protein
MTDATGTRPAVLKFINHFTIMHELKFIQISALVKYYSKEGVGVGAGAFFCITYRGKLLLVQHKLIRVPCTEKVLEHRYPLYRSTGIRFKQVVLD